MSTNSSKSGNASVERGETTLKPKLSSLVTIRQLVSLIAIFLGAIGFVLVDKKFKLHSYFWGVAYVVSMTVDMVLIKKIVTNVDLSTWGLVYYNNVLLWPRREKIRRRDHVYRPWRRQQNRYCDHKYRHLVAPRLAHGSHVPHGVRFRWGCLPTRSLEDEEKSKTVAQEKTIFAAPSGRERRRPTKDVVKSINNRIEESHLVYSARLCAINYKERMF